MVNMTENEFRAAVVAEAKTWIGTPYHHHGDLKGIGVDCAMILARVYSNVGAVEFIDPRPYPTDWMLHKDTELYLQQITPHVKETFDPKPGDIVIMKLGRTFSHSGIITEGTSLIHAYSRDRMVVTGDYTQFPFKGRPLKFFTVWKGQ